MGTYSKGYGKIFRFVYTVEMEAAVTVYGSCAACGAAVGRQRHDATPHQSPISFLEKHKTS